MYACLAGRRLSDICVCACVTCLMYVVCRQWERRKEEREKEQCNNARVCVCACACASPGAKARWNVAPKCRWLNMIYLIW